MKGIILEMPEIISHQHQAQLHLIIQVQLDIARRLEESFVWIQHEVKQQTLERLLASCHKAGVLIGLERSKWHVEALKFKLRIS